MGLDACVFPNDGKTTHVDFAGGGPGRQEYTEPGVGHAEGGYRRVVTEECTMYTSADEACRRRGLEPAGKSGARLGDGSRQRQSRSEAMPSAKIPRYNQHAQ